jgi:hypothetical protein
MTVKQKMSMKEYNIDRTYVILRLCDCLDLHAQLRNEDVWRCPVLFCFKRKITEYKQTEKCLEGVAKFLSQFG